MILDYNVAVGVFLSLERLLYRVLLNDIPLSFLVPLVSPITMIPNPD